MKAYIRYAIAVAGTILLIWFLIPLIFLGILNAGNIVGIIFSLAVLNYGILFDKINSIILKKWKSKTGKLVLSIISFAVLIIFVFVIAATAMIIRSANNAPPDNNTTVVVLGCQVRADGPSRMLVERLNAAYKYLNENKEVKCVLSGGKGEDEPVSEAECMYAWLTERGIDKNRLYIEDKSTSTQENLEFSKKVIEENNLSLAITIITNDFHQYRAEQIAKALGMKSYSVSGKTPVTLLPTYYVRELGGILLESM